ncbi:hypothetical protein GcM1_217048 [Golovinomyces cichoracearum]|uniref:Uncharacterized protein n=1 Tax=Golovinomyces cichoracearum TaxID=62708 RepID=A0A420IT54_9PEZI|nr:hypothetical protein GcM1_217048 [Golovinomyces cichoracearum]
MSRGFPPSHALSLGGSAHCAHCATIPPKAPLVHLYELIGLERAQPAKAPLISCGLWPVAAGRWPAATGHEAMSYASTTSTYLRLQLGALVQSPIDYLPQTPYSPPPLVPGFILIDLELQLARAGGKTTSTPLLLFLLLFVAQAIATAWRASLEIELEEAAG